jgi:hypothetical protein
MYLVSTKGCPGDAYLNKLIAPGVSKAAKQDFERELADRKSNENRGDTDAWENAPGYPKPKNASREKLRKARDLEFNCIRGELFKFDVSPRQADGTSMGERIEHGTVRENGLRAIAAREHNSSSLGNCGDNCANYYSIDCTPNNNHPDNNWLRGEIKLINNSGEMNWEQWAKTNIGKRKILDVQSTPFFDVDMVSGLEKELKGQFAQSTEKMENVLKDESFGLYYALSLEKCSQFLTDEQNQAVAKALGHMNGGSPPRPEKNPKKPVN